MALENPVFIDSNVPMYLIGSEHPHKLRSRVLLEELTFNKQRLVTSAEVFQEICHRYKAISRLDYLGHAFDLLSKLVDHIYPVTFEDVKGSKKLLVQYNDLSARDALHVAVMKNLGITQILSFDSDFDRISGVKRVF